MSRIIFADDDPLIGELVRELLTKEGHVVGLAEDGEAAVQAVLLKRPDLAILDVMMPGLGGVEAVRRIRASEATYSMPILMLSARRNEDDVQIALRAGADDYLRKPFDPDELVARVGLLLSDRRRVF